MSATVAPFVLVHGFGDSSETWAHLLPQLAGATYCWEVPGHGRRATVDEPPKTRNEAVAELGEWIANLGQPVTLVGHSLGGYLSLMLTIDRPDLVATLALISSGPGFRKDEARADWNRYIDSVAAKSGMLPTTTSMAHQPDSYVIDNLASIKCPLVHVIGARDTRYRAGADHLQKALPHSVLVEVADAGHHPQRSHPIEVAAAIRAEIAAPR